MQGFSWLFLLTDEAVGNVAHARTLKEQSLTHILSGLLLDMYPKNSTRVFSLGVCAALQSRRRTPPRLTHYCPLKCIQIHRLRQ